MTARPRRTRLVLVLVAVALFLGISAELARWLSTENIERDDVLGALQAQARGDATGLIAKLGPCAREPACVAQARADAVSLRRPGAVHVLILQSPTAYSLGPATGRTRVAWSVPGRLPVVQCVSVHRSGNVLTGISVTLLALSRPIGNTADC